ncbi:hypothetical protein D3OALGA1CA_5834 [Olavius algarvensis associated proteobacterium Delta 3]|nr:hypothetical protein D3OALGB2SA_1264 [Olavius algarvensis associated proteobacterium Delta 3]CAB5172455.1 hypothetical protein D3OALGA1CA_5834 [Olavius algarvensis associated proteobacterium Delta 3]
MFSLSLFTYEALFRKIDIMLRRLNLISLGFPAYKKKYSDSYHFNR